MIVSNRKHSRGAHVPQLGREKGLVSMKNPVVGGWYADPESRVYGDTVYLYVTRSLEFDEQVNLDVVMTRDLQTYEVCEGIPDMSTFPSARRAVWAPTALEKNGIYYLIFAANNIMTEEEVGGLYIGASTSPTGPFRNLFSDGRPLLNKIYNRAQPIDAHLYQDEDGAVYLYYGGWGHLMVCKMRQDMMGFEPMEGDAFGGAVKEITPPEYVEAPYVMKLGGRYHLMYSCGKWGNGTYHVRAAVADSPLGPFAYYDVILKADALADGPGHNSAFCFRQEWYVAYHRRIIGDTDKHHRVLCVDKLSVEGDKLHPVTMTE